MSKPIARDGSVGSDFEVASPRGAASFDRPSSVRIADLLLRALEEARRPAAPPLAGPIVEACMGGQKGEGPALEACRAKASPSVKACVMAAMNKAHGRANVAISIEDGKAKKETVNLGNALLVGFVPPPRTIADIAAVLDNEKPNPATLAQLKADADKEPSRGLSGDDLAEYYCESRHRAFCSWPNR